MNKKPMRMPTNLTSDQQVEYRLLRVEYLIDRLMHDLYPEKSTTPTQRSQDSLIIDAHHAIKTLMNLPYYVKLQEDREK